MLYKPSEAEYRQAWIERRSQLRALNYDIADYAQSRYKEFFWKSVRSAITLLLALGIGIYAVKGTAQLIVRSEYGDALFGGGAILCGCYMGAKAALKWLLEEWEIAVCWKKRYQEEEKLSQYTGNLKT